MIPMLIPASASASNMSAATPGCVLMPAPTSEIFAISGSCATPAAPISCASGSSARSAAAARFFGSVNEMSVCPSADTFWTIMSTLTPTSASVRKTRAAIPGRSGTARIVTSASEVSCAIPEMIGCSTSSS